MCSGALLLIIGEFSNDRPHMLDGKRGKSRTSNGAPIILDMMRGMPKCGAITNIMARFESRAVADGQNGLYAMMPSLVPV